MYATHYVCVIGSTSIVMCVEKIGEPRNIVRLHTAFIVSHKSLCSKSRHVLDGRVVYIMLNTS